MTIKFLLSLSFVLFVIVVAFTLASMIVACVKLWNNDYKSKKEFFTEFFFISKLLQNYKKLN